MTRMRRNRPSLAGLLWPTDQHRLSDARDSRPPLSMRSLLQSDGRDHLRVAFDQRFDQLDKIFHGIWLCDVSVTTAFSQFFLVNYKRSCDHYRYVFGMNTILECTGN